MPGEVKLLSHEAGVPAKPGSRVWARKGLPKEEVS